MSSEDIHRLILTNEELNQILAEYPIFINIVNTQEARKKEQMRKNKLQYYYRHKDEIKIRRKERDLLKRSIIST